MKSIAWASIPLVSVIAVGIFFLGVVSPVGDNDACRAAAELGGEGMELSAENTVTALNMANDALGGNSFNIDSDLNDLDRGQSEFERVVDEYINAAEECGINAGPSEFDV